MRKAVDITGRVFGRLTVVSAGPRDRNDRPRWRCRCECGAIVDVKLSALQSGNNKSCGCLRRETAPSTSRAAATHGASGTPTYISWQGMKTRCRKSNLVDLLQYGGRGISVCERWLGPDGLSNFLADMGPRPDGTTLDRKDNNRGYEPGNCRWATHAEQAQNRRSTRFTIDDVNEIRGRAEHGEPMTSIATRFHASYGAIKDVVRRKTWSHAP